MPVPAKIANAPELAPGLELFYGAFWELSTCRPLGFGEGPIPWTAIDRYAEVNGFEGEQREDLLFHLGAMDRAYLRWRSKQNAK